MQRRIRLEQDRFLLFLTLHRRESFLRRMKITGGEGLPYLDEVDFKIVGSADTALLELQGGSIDIYAYLTDSQANELKDSFNVISSPSNVVPGIVLKQ